jgi:hypothetical protein
LAPRPTPLYHYILHEYQEDDNMDSVIQSVFLVGFVAVIIVCQVSIFFTIFQN